MSFCRKTLYRNGAGRFTNLGNHGHFAVRDKQMRKKDVLTTGQVAQICNVAPRTVSKWFDSGQLKGYRIPGSKDRRIPLNELLNFMRAHEIPTNNICNENLRVLLIDSNREYAHQLARSLQNRGGMNVTCASNIFEAGLLAVKFSPSIIVLNLMSDGIDARQICSYIHQTEELQNCTLIGLAGGLSKNEAEHLHVYGFDDIVLNTCEVDSIITAICSPTCVAR